MTQLNTLKAFFDFFVSSHETLLMLKHRYYFLSDFFIKGCLIEPNVLFMHFSTFHLKDILTFNVGLVIYPIAKSLICSSFSLTQRKLLSLCNRCG